MKILLAEDQTMVRTALASLLRLESDYHVDEAVDGIDAQKNYKNLITMCC